MLTESYHLALEKEIAYRSMFLKNLLSRYYYVISKNISSLRISFTMVCLQMQKTDLMFKLQNDLSLSVLIIGHLYTSKFRKSYMKNSSYEGEIIVEFGEVQVVYK